MEIIVVGICVLLYLAVGKNIEYFVNISALGFRSECPQIFLTNPKIYLIARYFLLVVVGVVPHIFDKNYGLILALVCWLVVRFYGRTLACNQYRKILTEMARDGGGFASEEEEKVYLVEASKTNSELAKKIKEYKI